jgi:hypothetical protein
MLVQRASSIAIVGQSQRPLGRTAQSGPSDCRQEKGEYHRYAHGCRIPDAPDQRWWFCDGVDEWEDLIAEEQDGNGGDAAYRELHRRRCPCAS